MYIPYTLPPLPRKQCPYEEIYQDRHGSLKYRLCTGVTHPNGWCAEHQYVAEILDLAASASYPEVQVNASLVIGSKIAAWEAYAVRLPFERYAALKRKVQEVKREGEQQNAAVRMRRSAA